MRKKTIIVCISLAALIVAGFVFLSWLTKDDRQTASPASKKTTATKSLAEKALEEMDLEEKVGQLFLVCVSNQTISKQDIADYHLGGYLFFADFFQERSKQTAAADIASYQKAASVPMLMAADEEGGTVVRVSKFAAYRSEPFLSPQSLYRVGGLDAIAEQESEKADLLLSLGINVNLAPVCDVAEDEGSFIYKRTLGEDAQTTAQYISRVITIMNEKKIGSALKHFPGYGQNADTHTDSAVDDRSLKTFEEKDFLPFQGGISAGAPCVLVSHNIVNCMDAKNPASLSKKVHQILREKLNFQGVIVTDDLSMAGAQHVHDGENIAVTAILAGNDLLCTNDYKEQIPAVIDAVKSGKISEEQITASAARILQWKEALGLLETM